VAAGNGDRGDVLAVRVTVTDGTHATTAVSSTVLVVDAAPVVDSATFAPPSAHTNDLLTASATARDADNDALTYAYQWTRNASDIPGATAATLDLSIAGHGDRDDSIAVRVTASDGTLTSTPVTSDTVAVADTGPVMSVALNTSSPTTQTVLVATATASDADGDALTFTYVWNVNGVTKRTTVTTASSDSFDLGKPGNGNKGDAVTVDVTVSDGTLGATASAGATVVAGRGR
jgi:hypothetical protein